jgi:peptidoglycan/LPS O-acetylase OafA/YrhL
MSDIAPRKNGEDVGRVRRLMVLFGGVLAAVGMFFAVWSRGQERQLIDIALDAMTIMYGGILGTFLVALIARTRGSDASATAGLLVGIACGAVGFFCFGKTIAFPWRLLFSTAMTVLVACSGRRAVKPA